MKLVNLVESQVIKVIAEFIEAYSGEEGTKEWGTDLGTCSVESGTCAMVSETFNNFCRSYGLNPKYVTGNGATNPNWVNKAEGDAHTATFLHNQVIDFTARQFDSSLDFPRITTLEEFKAEWKDISVY